MFTGLVEKLGTIAQLERRGHASELAVAAGSLATGAKLGDSIAINGCCLTVTRIEGDHLSFEAGAETLQRTTLGERRPGDRVNLERALQAGDRLGGHYVTGHVDTVGKLVRRDDDPPWAKLWFQIPEEYAPQLASKGSIAVDGVSLTLVDVTDREFSVALIPHTLQHTTLGALRENDRVNLETDVLAKYVQRQMELHFGWQTDKRSAT